MIKILEGGSQAAAGGCRFCLPFGCKSSIAYKTGYHDGMVSMDG